MRLCTLSPPFLRTTLKEARLQIVPVRRPEDYFYYWYFHGKKPGKKLVTYLCPPNATIPAGLVPGKADIMIHESWIGGMLPGV
jgi:hypothetical protein